MASSTFQNINLTAEQKKIFDTPTAFYDYLREKYYGEDMVPEHEPFLKQMTITLPRFESVSGKEPKWNIILERKLESDTDNGERYLVFGAHDIGGSMWSRLVQLDGTLHQNLRGDEYYAKCRYKVIANNLFESGLTSEYFYAVITFFKIMEEFLRQY